MNVLEVFSLALKNIWANKLRTLLTMLGIVIGVCAVIVIVGLGNGMQNYIRQSFADMGTDTITVNVLGRGSARSISQEQMYAIAEEEGSLFSDLSPTVDLQGGVRIGTASASATTVTGVSEAYLEMKGYVLSQGRDLDFVDMTGRKKVCVIGQYLDRAYFGGNALGQTLRINGNALTVVGVLAQKGTTLEEGGSDDCVFLPYTTAQRMSRTGTIGTYTLTVADTQTISQAKTLLESKLYEVFSDDGAYVVTSMAELVSEMNSMVGLVIAVLAGIAAISLVVGGIGIMNIMLVSVTERTREIGIRKALGAREGVILRQFTTEAAVTSALGGAIGIALGIALSGAASGVIAAALPDTPITVSPSLGAVAAAFGVSAGIGVLFGYLPARKAARLDPIDALRHD